MLGIEPAKAVTLILMKSGRSFFSRIVRAVVYLVVGAAVLVGLMAVVVFTMAKARLGKRHDVKAEVVAVPSDPAMVERGRHLVVTRGCADCHGKDFGGAKVVDDPMIGQLHGPNLTRGKGGVPSGFSDADYVRAIRHGVDRTGRAFVLMPSQEYSFLSDQDLGAMIAYLKTLPAVDRERGPVTLGPLGKVLVAVGEIKLAGAEIDHTAKRPETVVEGVTAKYGGYLAAGCTGCHGSNLSGGKVPGAPPEWPAAANLTPFAGTGVAQWTEQEFLVAMRTFKRPDGSQISPVMPAGVGQMTQQELSAIWLYLKSLPPTPHAKRDTQS